MNKGLEPRLSHGRGDLVESVPAIRIENRNVDPLDKRELTNLPLKNGNYTLDSLAILCDIRASGKDKS
jgi:hypothetical protein